MSWKRWLFVVAAGWSLGAGAQRVQAESLFKPGEGLYLGIIHSNMSSSYVETFVQDASKRAAVYGGYINFMQGVSASDFNNWVTGVKSSSPGSGLFITMEPWGCFTNFFINWHPGNPCYDKTLLYAQQFRDTELPVFLSFAHEANGNWYNWSPAYANIDLISNSTYIVGWRNFASLIKSNAPNVSMVWSMNAEGTRVNEVQVSAPTAIYPGDDLVDWVGLSVYNGFGYGNDRNEVTDHKLYHPLHGGFWNQFDDFYTIFSDPANTSGHHKPMVLSETGCYAPMSPPDTNFPYTKDTVLAEFNTLWAGTSTKELILDHGSSTEPWGNSTWNPTCMTLSIDNDALKFVPIAFNNGVYVSGAMNQNLGMSDWSSVSKFRLNIRRISNSQVNPRVRIQLRSGTIGDTNRADYSVDVGSSTFVDVDRLKSNFALTGNFSWSDIKAMTLRIESTGTTNQLPAGILIDYIMVLYQAPDLDQQWSAVSTKSGASLSAWSVTNQAGSLYVAGTPNPSGDLAESSFTLANGNWSTYTNLYLQMKKTTGNPVLRVRITDAQGHYGIHDFSVTNTDWQPFVVPLKSVVPSDSFDWTGVRQVLFDVRGAPGASLGLLVDEMSLGYYSTNTIRHEIPSEIVFNKKNWLRQLYSVEDYQTDIGPDALGLRTNFPNLQMINYFNVSKVVNGVLHDYRISGTGIDSSLMALYNELTSNDYFLAAVKVPAPALTLSTNSLSMIKGGQQALTVQSSAQPVLPVTWQLEKISGDTDISKVSGDADHTFRNNDWNTAWSMAFSAAIDNDDFANGSAQFRFRCGDSISETVTVRSVGGYSWHTPSAAEPPDSTMRDPSAQAASIEPVAIYNGTLANAFTQTGGVLYHRKSGQASWSASAFSFDRQTVVSGKTNAYWKAVIPADTYAGGDTVEYYLKVAYGNCDTTYIDASDSDVYGAISLTEATAQTVPFSFTYAQNYLITASAGGQGTIEPAGEISLVAGRSQLFSISSSNFYRIADILIDGVSAGLSLGNTDTVYAYTWNNASAPGTIEAVFTETVTTNNPGNVPQLWLAQYYPEAPDYENAADTDTDGDGLSAWREYIAGTDPTSASSTLEVETLPAGPNSSDPVIRWMSAGPTQRYSIYWTDDLSGDWSALASGLQYDEASLQSYTDTVHQAAQPSFYRVQVERNP